MVVKAEKPVLNEQYLGNPHISMDSVLLTGRDYITEYQFRAKNEQVRKLVDALGLDISKLENLMNVGVTESNINEYGRFDDLKKTIVRDKAKAYFKTVEGTSIPSFRLSIKIEKLLKDFILSGGFDISDDEIK